METEGKKVKGKCRARSSKGEASLEYGGVDGDGDQVGQGSSSSREEKVSSLKTVSAVIAL